MPSSDEVGAAPYRAAEAAPGAAPVRGPTLTTADGQLFSSPIGTADRRGGREGGESSEPLRLGWSAPYPCRSGSSRGRASPRRHPLQQVHAHRHLRDVDGTCHLLAATCWHGGDRSHRHARSLERPPLLVVLGRVQLLPSLLQRVVPGVHGPAIERSLLLKAPPPRLDVLLAPPARGTGQTVRAIGKGPRVPGVRSAWPASLGGSARRGTAASARGTCRTAAAQARHPPPSWNAGRRPCTRRRPSLALTFGSAERCVQRARPRYTLVPALAAIGARPCALHAHAHARRARRQGRRSSGRYTK